ncbi:MAG: tRNA dihydrouridine synthase DusB [Treponema sp.]|nr:tRNA dihydrouridine synthase DusB [Treponema sp.]
MSNLYHPVKIGNVELKGNIFLAPVAGYSDMAFRSVCIENGACFTYTEMVSAEALVRQNQKTEVLMRRAFNEKAYAVQIFGGEAGVMADAAGIVLEKTGCEVIDINCGCPVPKIVKTGAGSALTRDPDRLFAVASAVVKACGGAAGGEGSTAGSAAAHAAVPVTVKIRSGWEQKQITWREAALAALEAGVSAITIHPRTKAQGYEGHSDWEIMAALVELVEGWNKAHPERVRVPVFGSGDLFKPDDARKMLEQTKADGVMFARGAMGNPFIFRDTTSLLTTGKYEPVPLQERIKTGFAELERLVGETSEQHACLEMRKRFSAYSKGIENGAALRARIVHAATVQDYRDIFSGVM